MDVMTQRSAPDDDWIRLHYPRLLRGARLLCENQAESEDLVQETLIQAISHWDQFDGRCQEYTWLYAIMLRLQLKRRRSYARAAVRLIRWWEQFGREQATEDPAKTVADQQWRQSIWAQVKCLPDVQSQAIFLRFAEGMSYEEIAGAMECAPETARTRVFYGLRTLRKTMEPMAIQREKKLDSIALFPNTKTSLSND